MIGNVEFTLSALDTERAVGFYRDALGLEVKVQSAGWSEIAEVTDPEGNGFMISEDIA